MKNTNIAMIRCVVSQPVAVAKYKFRIRNIYHKTCFIERLEKAKKEFIKESLSDELWKEIDDLDNERRNYMLYLERRC